MRNRGTKMRYTIRKQKVKLRYETNYMNNIKCERIKQYT